MTTGRPLPGRGSSTLSAPIIDLRDVVKRFTVGGSEIEVQFFQLLPALTLRKNVILPTALAGKRLAYG